MWLDTDGKNILVNTATGRLKTPNIKRDSRVAIAVFGPINPYSRFLNISDLVANITELGAVGHINTLAENVWGNQFTQVTTVRRQG